MEGSHPPGSLLEELMEIKYPGYVPHWESTAEKLNEFYHGAAELYSSTTERGGGGGGV